MYFNGKISVTINDSIELKTIVSISATNDSKHVGADCSVVVPLNCRMEYKNGRHDYLTQQANTAFKSGDRITIKAWYEGFQKITVFDGYIVDFITGNPTTIKCMDYIYLLDQSTLDLSYTSIKLKDLLTIILKGTEITLNENILDMTLENITFRLMSPAAILEWIKKELGINISLTGTELYCNLASNVLSMVKYSTERNVLTSGLQRPDAVFTQYKVKAWFIREDGTKDSVDIGPEDGQLREVFYYKVTPRTSENYTNLAKEALLKFKQNSYSGSIETLLYPDCDLFWKAEYKDIRYPEKNGNYVVTGDNINIDNNGYRRTLKLAYLSDLIV